MFHRLKGIRVVELGTVLAGPIAGALLGDLGAEVIKVEPVEGEAARLWPPVDEAGESAFYLAFNRSKKGIALDLKSDEGRDIYLKLVQTADIIIDNYRMGVSDSMGVGYDAIKSIKADIIYCSISGFGRDGPRAKEPAMELLMQAFSGLMDLTGEPDRPPSRVPTATSDLGAGLYAVVGALAALRTRDATGEGSLVETTLLESQMAFLTNFWAAWEVSGELPKRAGSAHPSMVPYQAFHVKNGAVILACMTEKHFTAACQALSLDKKYTQDPQYRSQDARKAHREEILDVFSAALADYTVTDIVEHMLKHGVPCTPINNLEQVLEDPQVTFRGGLAHVQHPRSGTIHMPRLAIRFDNTTPDTYQAAPLLGQHTEHVLLDLGFSQDDIQRLHKTHIVKTTPV